MRRVFTVIVVAFMAVVGCKKSASDAPVTDSPAVKNPTTVTSPTTPTKKSIEMGNPEFEKMLADFKADPKSTKYQRELVTFKMIVESVKEVNKENYLIKGKGEGGKVDLVCTFMLPPNLDVNNRARSVGPGNKLTYLAGPYEYKPGDPVPTITSAAGSILAVEMGKK